MVMRLKERAVWAAKGVLVWLLQRPYLHWLPLRYPATASLEKWMSQATTQVQSKALPERHLKWAQKKKLFTMANLGECVHLRNRLGLQCEDPLLDGMLEGVAMKGMTKGLRRQRKPKLWKPPDWPEARRSARKRPGR
jgi:uncharacterized protein (DUF3820 family)